MPSTIDQDLLHTDRLATGVYYVHGPCDDGIVAWFSNATWAWCELADLLVLPALPDERAAQLVSRQLLRRFPGCQAIFTCEGQCVLVRPPWSPCSLAQSPSPAVPPICCD